MQISLCRNLLPSFLGNVLTVDVSETHCSDYNSVSQSKDMEKESQHQLPCELEPIRRNRKQESDPSLRSSDMREKNHETKRKSSGHDSLSRSSSISLLSSKEYLRLPSSPSFEAYDALDMDTLVLHLNLIPSLIFKWKLEEGKHLENISSKASGKHKEHSSHLSSPSRNSGLDRDIGCSELSAILDSVPPLQLLKFSNLKVSY